ncbi:hypothetical protein WN51_06300 [Melipona quadrifasciata]|uniref:Uncharacterized protein n=1 Tax=Melipona quadrifasciata TaxID=166423 RepID=A0A0M8ZQY8_9HYME|nr:hypothetical protein WN51_06300 [Melipona quadrifasciata]
MTPRRKFQPYAKLAAICFTLLSPPEHWELQMEEPTRYYTSILLKGTKVMMVWKDAVERILGRVSECGGREKAIVLRFVLESLPRLISGADWQRDSLPQTLVVITKPTKAEYFDTVVLVLVDIVIYLFTKIVLNIVHFFKNILELTGGPRYPLHLLGREINRQRGEGNLNAVEGVALAMKKVSRLCAKSAMTNCKLKLMLRCIRSFTVKNIPEDCKSQDPGIIRTIRAIKWNLDYHNLSANECYRTHIKISDARNERVKNDNSDNYSGFSNFFATLYLPMESLLSCTRIDAANMTNQIHQTQMRKILRIVVEEFKLSESRDQTAVFHSHRAISTKVTPTNNISALNPNIKSRQSKLEAMSYIREHDRVRGSIKGNPQHLAASVLADPCSRAQHRTWCEASRFGLSQLSYSEDYTQLCKSHVRSTKRFRRNEGELAHVRFLDRLKRFVLKFVKGNRIILGSSLANEGLLQSIPRRLKVHNTKKDPLIIFPNEIIKNFENMCLCRVATERLNDIKQKWAYVIL